MKNKILISSVAMLLVVLVPLGAGHSKPYYEGKTFTFVVSTKPGGGYDFYGRLGAKFMEKYLPGSTIIIRNIPGAGHIIGVNHLYHCKPDGLTFGLFDRGLYVSQVVGLKGIKFDLAKMSWIGSFASEPRVFLVAKHTPYKTLDDVVKSDRPVTFACHGIGEMQYMEAMVVAKILGAKNWKPMTGYAGGEGELAMMRGELAASSGSWASMRPFIESGEGRAVMFTSETPVKGYEDVPLLPKVVGKEYKPVVDLMLFLVRFNRPVAGPPGIPTARLQILREAFKKALHDPELLKMVEKARRPIDYIGGEEAEKLIKVVLDQPPEIVKLLKEAYGVK